MWALNRARAIAKKGCFVSASHRVNDLSDSEAGISCALAGECWLSVPSGDISGLRNRVAATFAPTLAMSVLRHVDDQSLVALAALKQAREETRLSADESRSWGIVAAPRLLGRKRIADGLAKFREQGAWSVSPHLIPHCSLHSLPGLLSQGLQIHGPNIGAGGMPGSEPEAIWAALSILERDRVPGIWIVLTGWNRETGSDSSCQAAVLGLKRIDGYSSMSRFQFVLSGETGRSKPFTLESVGDSIRNRKEGRWNLGGAIAELTYTAARMEAAA